MAKGCLRLGYGFGGDAVKSGGREERYNVTHDEALAVLTAWIVAAGRGSPTSLERRGAAEEHVSRCPDCWAELSATHQLIVGSPPEAADRMRELFGCATIQEQLYLLVGLTPAAMEKQHPHLAQHLAWCHACQDLLMDLLDMEELRDEVRLTRARAALPTVAPARPRWVAITATHGERLLEMVGQFVVRVGREAAALVQWPEGMEPVPVAVVRGPMRGRDDTRRGPGDTIPPLGGEPPGRGFHFDLGDAGLSVNLVIAPEGERVRLSLLAVRGDRPIAMTLRRIEGDRKYLVAAQSTAGAEELVA